MSIIEAILLGIVQGITEFLPISSDGHLELANVMMGINSSESLPFIVILHGATTLSVLVVFYRDILNLLRSLFRLSPPEDMRYIAKLLISMVPVGIVGLFFKDQVESLFSGNLLLTGGCLIFTGLLLWLSQFNFSGKENQDVSYGQAFIIGCFQALAVLPGLSRSGSTISTALMMGIGKEKATRFSFLMVIVPILGALLLEVKHLFETPPTADSTPLSLYLIGFVTAFLCGIWACKVVLAAVRRGKLSWFAYYCFAVGSIAILFAIRS